MSANDHGTASTYRNYGCRCEPCTKASTEKLNEWRSRIRQSPVSTEAHGTIGTYTNYRCRCAACRAANAAYMREYHANHKAATA